MKRSILAFSLVLCLVLLCACGMDTPIESASAPAQGDSVGRITLSPAGAESSAGGVKIAGSTVTITSAGTYSLSGTLDEGQIIVNTGEDAGKVSLILDNASVRCSDGPALLVERAKKLDLVIADGTVNTLTSGVEGTELDPEASGGAIDAHDDMDIEGDNSGTLNVFGYINSGIVCKDDIEIKCGGCTLNVTAVNNGIKGTDSVTVSGGEVHITAGHDGIKSTQTDKPGKGFVAISGGTVTITADADAFDAASGLTVSGGRVLASGKSKSVKTFDPSSTQSFRTVELNFARGDELAAAGLCVTAAHKGNLILISAPDDMALTVNGKSAG